MENKFENDSSSNGPIKPIDDVYDENVLNPNFQLYTLRPNYVLDYNRLMILDY